MCTECGERLFKSSGWALLIGALAMAVSIAAAPDTQAKAKTHEAKPQSGWVLVQQTLTGGKQILSVTVDGIKIVNEDTHFTTISRAPAWNVLTCNDANKIFMETAFAKFHGRYLRRLDQLRFADLSVPLQSLSGEPLMGFKTMKFVMKPGPVQSTDEMLAFTVIALDQPPQPANACSLLCHMYGIRSIGKIPLQIGYRNMKNRLRMRLTTKSISTRNDITISMQPPAGYTRTTEESKLMLDSKGKMEMDDMVDSLGK